MITAAAAIMVCVFGASAISGQRALAMFGLGLAAAVFLDAFVVRMLLLPAVLQLLGRATWTLPRPLERRLPGVAIENRRLPEPAAEGGSRLARRAEGDRHYQRRRQRNGRSDVRVA